MKTICIILVVVALVQLSHADRCHLRELDLCAATALLSLQSNPIPQSEEQIDEQCTYLKETVDCLHNYTKTCTTPTHQELIALVSQESEDNLNQLCTPGSDIRKELLEHASCLADVWDDQRTCMSDAQAGLELLSEPGNKKKITIACCTYQRFRECGMKIVKDKCGETAMEFINRFISLYLSDIPNIVCVNYGSNNPDCKVLPPPGTPPKGESESAISRLLAAYIGN